jgi:hypothetical protein
MEQHHDSDDELTQRRHQDCKSRANLGVAECTGRNAGDKHEQELRMSVLRRVSGAIFLSD